MAIFRPLELFTLGIFINSVWGQNPSPCPEVFKYESRGSELDRWYGVLTLTTAEELRGVWIHVVLDRKAELLGNWFGEPSSKDNTEFTIRNSDYRLEAGPPVSVRFFVKYNAASTIPSLVEIRLNGRKICPATTPPRVEIPYTTHPNTTHHNSRPGSVSRPGTTRPTTRPISNNHNDRDSRPSTGGSNIYNPNNGYNGNDQYGNDNRKNQDQNTNQNSYANTERNVHYYDSRGEGYDKRTNENTNDYDNNDRMSTNNNRGNNNNQGNNRGEGYVNLNNNRTLFLSRRAPAGNNNNNDNRGTGYLNNNGNSNDRPGYQGSNTNNPNRNQDRESLDNRYNENNGEGNRGNGNDNGFNNNNNNGHNSNNNRQPTSGIDNEDDDDDDRRPSGPDSNNNDFFMGDFAVTLNRPSSSRPSQSGNDDQACGVVATRPSPLISHGQNTTPGQWPWHAALYHSKGIQLTYTCGGTLISNKFILTAAHCVTKPQSARAISPQNILVYLGKYNLKKFGTEVQDKEVNEIFVHPDYNYTVYFNDVALLKLASRAEITDYVKPCCLWEDSTDLDSVLNRQGTVIGWGFDEHRQLSNNLMQAQMPVVSTVTCIYSNREFFSQFTSEKSYCAGFRNGTSVCNGDSGGSMVFPRRNANGQTVWQIRGLVSVGVALQGQGVCDPSQYIVFTDVAKQLDWIKRIMNNN